MTDGREVVFVYGTLRRGASNHWRMEGAEYVGKAVVRGRMYRISWYPGLVRDRKVGEVVGEIYGVSRELLASLDRFEGDEFGRVRAEVQRVEAPDGTESVWLWEWKGDARHPVVRGGDWVEAERPVPKPLFLAIAWVAVLAGPAVTLLTGPAASHPVWLKLAGLFSSSVVMAAAGGFSWYRNERGRRWALIPLLLGGGLMVWCGLLTATVLTL